MAGRTPLRFQKSSVAVGVKVGKNAWRRLARKGSDCRKGGGRPSERGGGQAGGRKRNVVARGNDDVKRPKRKVKTKGGPGKEGGGLTKKMGSLLEGVFINFNREEGRNANRCRWKVVLWAGEKGGARKPLEFARRLRQKTKKHQY